MRFKFKCIVTCVVTTTALLIVNASADKLSFSDLPGWHSDNLEHALRAWQNSCKAFSTKGSVNWIDVCEKAQHLTPEEETIRRYFEHHFRLSMITSDKGSTTGVITGYYEPILQGSLEKNATYNYPVYGKPDNSKLQSLTRKDIEQRPHLLESNILLWTDNPYDLYFLHVQGSGRVMLTNGAQKSLVYAGNNGHDYTSIGNVLINLNEINPDDVSLESIKAWLTNHPDLAPQVLQKNQRYIFFDLIDTPVEQTNGPKGSLNVPLTAERSIAIDPGHIPIGSPVFLSTTLPARNGQTINYNRLMFAQDTGAAIKGQVRADVFFGKGERAEFLAGNMKHKGRLYLLQPR